MTTTTATQCRTCNHSVSAAHVTDSYACKRAAGMTPEEADR